MAVRSEAVARAEAVRSFHPLLAPVWHANKYSSCGSPVVLLESCLASLGIDATVQAETSELPGATFQIKSNQAKT